MTSLIEIVQVRILISGQGSEVGLRPEIIVKEVLRGPDGTTPAAPTLEGMIAIAVANSKKLDMGRGRTFIHDFDARPYKSNGPWSFSAATNERHGLMK